MSMQSTDHTLPSPEHDGQHWEYRPSHAWLPITDPLPPPAPSTDGRPVSDDPPGYHLSQQYGDAEQVVIYERSSIDGDGCKYPWIVFFCPFASTIHTVCIDTPAMLVAFLAEVKPLLSLWQCESEIAFERSLIASDKARNLKRERVFRNGIAPRKRGA
jgi:hypothetical protein